MVNNDEFFGLESVVIAASVLRSTRQSASAGAWARMVEREGAVDAEVELLQLRPTSILVV
jgi:hypothetical protein